MISYVVALFPTLPIGAHSCTLISDTFTCWTLVGHILTPFGHILTPFGQYLRESRLIVGTLGHILDPFFRCDRLNRPW